MIVYVESNFVLELALGQEQATAAESILACAQRHEIALAIPWISLAEPFSTVEKRSRDRQLFIRQLERQLSDMGRSQRLEEAVQRFGFAPTLLSEIGSDETDYLIRATERVLGIASVVTMDVTRFRQAMEYRTRFSYSPQDALVFASVVGHLTENQQSGPHYFVTRDRDDFGATGIADVLRTFNCEILFSFPEMALLLDQPPPD